MFWGKKELATQPMNPIEPARNLFIPLARTPYIIRYLDDLPEDRKLVLRDTVVQELIAETDRNTVFVCGGFASYIAGLTSSYGDIDYFCTSRDTFYDITAQLERQQRITDDIKKGEYNGFDINVIYNGGAVCMEDFLDGFDNTWCRVGIDFVERAVIQHNLAHEADLVFDEGCFKPELMGYDPALAAQRAYDRYLKYKKRRITECRLDDESVRSEISQRVANAWRVPLLYASQSNNSNNPVRTHY